MGKPEAFGGVDRDQVCETALQRHIGVLHAFELQGVEGDDGGAKHEHRDQNFDKRETARESTRRLGNCVLTK